MRLARFWRMCAFVASGAFLLQTGGCTTVPFLDILWTILLGVTAGAAVWLAKEAS